jgi:hypothetical protein
VSALCPHRADSQQVGGFSGGEGGSVAVSGIEPRAAVLAGSRLMAGGSLAGVSTKEVTDRGGFGVDRERLEIGQY